MKIAIIGRTQSLYETALKLHSAGHRIVGVVTAEAAPEYTRTERDFESLAQELGVPFFLTRTLDKPEIEEVLSKADLGISTNWVSVITQKHIDLFRLGILNSHSGDLPRFRGNACANWAILAGEDRVTNTIHFMEGGRLDCGRIVAQDHLPIGEDTTIADIYCWTERALPGLYVTAVEMIEKDNNYSLKHADPEDPAGFRCFPRLPEDGYIDWTRPVVEIHRLVRAVTTPFAGAYTFHWEKETVRKLIVLESRIDRPGTPDLAAPGHVLYNNRETGESLVRCGEGVITLSRCRYADEVAEFAPGRRWKSIRMRLGVRPEDWLWWIQNRE